MITIAEFRALGFDRAERHGDYWLCDGPACPRWDTIGLIEIRPHYDAWWIGNRFIMGWMLHWYKESYRNRAWGYVWEADDDEAAEALAAMFES